MLSNAIRMINLPLRTSVAVCGLLISSAIVSVLATPTYKTLSQAPILEEVIPLQLGTWGNKPSPYAQVSVNTGAPQLSDVVYEQVLMRTYEDTSGNQLMLAVAFAGEQRQEIKIHQPEVCYPAQGYQTLAIIPHTFNLHGYPNPIAGKQLIFKKDNRLEAVSYWIRLGNSFPTTGMQMRLKILEEGLKGNLDDGVLVRVSTLINQESDAPLAYQLHEKFLAELVAAGTSKPGLLVPTIAK